MPAKPAPDGPRLDYDSGPPAAQRLDTTLRHVLGVPRDELLRREKAWQKGRKKIVAKRARATP